MSKSIELLTTKRFLPLFLTQFLGAFNDNLFKNAMVVMITYRLAAEAGINAQLAVTMAAGLFILPFFLFSATAGQMADKYEKSALVRKIKLIEIVLMGFAIVGFYISSVPMLMGVLFCMGTQSTFFGPIKYSVLPQHLREDELVGGNALVEAGTFLAILLGTIVGGLLILVEGGLWWVGLSMIGVGIAGYASSRFMPEAPAPEPGIVINPNIFAQTWKMIGFARERSDVFLSIIGISWFWLVGATFLAQFPSFVQNQLAADEGVVILFLTVFSVGIGVGSMVCSYLMRGEVHGRFVSAGALGMALFTFLFYWLTPTWGISIDKIGGYMDVSAFLEVPRYVKMLSCLLMIAICGGIYIVPLYAIMQARSSEQHRARIIAANNVMNALFMVFSALGTLAMLKLGFAVRDVFLVLAVVNVPVAWLIRRVVRKEIKKQKEQE